ncbi:MAG TPA: hypothetical protein EYP28_07000 [Methanophagales archaeon]|nr:hypothetical protein [Methanophagales archaeon]
MDIENVFPKSGESGIYGSMNGVKQKWRVLDTILMLLQDSQWHSVKEIDEEIRLPEEKLAPIFGFFADFGFISHRGEQSMVKIEPSGLKLLELYSE